MAKIMIHSNAIWASTGYGVQTGLLANALARDGHTVTNSANYGLHGSPINVNGIEVIGGGKDVWGNDVIKAHQQFYQADVTIGLYDIWAMQESVLSSLENYWHWLPLDHDPIVPMVMSRLPLITGIIAMSEFGHKQLSDVGFESTYIPHAIDTTIFKPMDKLEARTMVNFPHDKFIVGMFMANKGSPSRKRFDQQIRAFAMFTRSHPDSMLYIHSDITGHGGDDLNRLIELAETQFAVKLNVRFVNQYRYGASMVSANEIATLMNACDIVSNATGGEGFGVPIIEAQACGTPVIVTDFSAMPELVVGGYKVGYTDLQYTTLESYQCNPSVKAIFEALVTECYTAEKSEFRRQLISKTTHEKYGIDTVYETYWQPFIERVSK